MEGLGEEVGREREGAEILKHLVGCGISQFFDVLRCRWRSHSRSNLNFLTRLENEGRYLGAWAVWWRMHRGALASSSRGELW